MGVVAAVLALAMLMAVAAEAGSREGREKKPAGRNDAMAFVYEWYSAMEKKKSDKFFLSRVANTEFELTLPDSTPAGAQAKDADAFKEWRKTDRKRLKTRSYEVQNVKSTGDPAKGFEVRLNVRLTGATKDGEQVDESYRQVFRLKPSTDGKLVLVRLQTERI
jgi:ketosteroid isomerase-like protein